MVQMVVDGVFVETKPDGEGLIDVRRFSVSGFSWVVQLDIYEFVFYFTAGDEIYKKDLATLNTKYVAGIHHDVAPKAWIRFPSPNLKSELKGVGNGELAFEATTLSEDPYTVKCETVKTIKTENGKDATTKKPFGSVYFYRGEEKIPGLKELSRTNAQQFCKKLAAIKASLLADLPEAVSLTTIIGKAGNYAVKAFKGMAKPVKRLFSYVPPWKRDQEPLAP